MKSKCTSKNWLFLDNSNIDRSFLNYRGLHLNHNGSKLLQENIANILTSHRWNEQGSRKSAPSTSLNIPKVRGFKMAMLNVASLTKYIDEICVLLHDKKLDVLAFNETHLDSSISDELLQSWPKLCGHLCKNTHAAPFREEIAPPLSPQTMLVL